MATVSRTTLRGFLQNAADGITRTTLAGWHQWQIAAGGGSITGTIAASEGADTSSIAAAVEVSGTIAAEEGADASAIAAAVEVSGTITATEGSDTASITAGLLVVAAIDAAEGADASSISAALEVSATIDAQEAGDTSAITASVFAGRVATLDAEEAPDTFAGAGEVLIAGVIDAQEQGDTCAISAAIPLEITTRRGAFNPRALYEVYERRLRDEETRAQHRQSRLSRKRYEQLAETARTASTVVSPFDVGIARRSDADMPEGESLSPEDAARMVAAVLRRAPPAEVERLAADPELSEFGRLELDIRAEEELIALVY